MIEIQFRGKTQVFTANTIGQKLKLMLKEKDAAAKNCIAFFDKENGTLYDLHTQIQGPVTLEVVEAKNSSNQGNVKQVYAKQTYAKQANDMLRASLAFVLANCVDGQLVEIQVANSPIDGAFTAKFITNEPISESDFEFIEKKMLRVIDGDIEFEKIVRSYEDSIEHIKSIKSFDMDSKLWQLDEHGPNIWYALGEVAIPTNLQFLKSSSECLKHFKLQKVAQEEYMTASGEKIKVQKITVAAFFTQQELDSYLTNLELLKQNDHRLIGQAMDLFYMIPEAAGSVFWLPRGWKLFKALEAFIRKFSYADYQEVRTPFVMSSVFWERSGHMQAYGKNMMHINMGDHEHECAALKPMNCPGHIEIFKQKIRSYRDLPFRIAELGSCHRYEPSGSLHGLLRVRSFTMDDGHIFCTREQIQSEIERFVPRAMQMYKHFGFDDVSIKIATRPDGFLGNALNWDYAENVMQDAMRKLGLPFEIAQGEGAFYGPKVEMHIKDSLGRSWQLGTIQLDFVLPERFDITYIDDAGQKQQPCMLHRAMLGSMERFIAVLLEHTCGNVPLDLAPVQVAVCSVVTDCNEYATLVAQKLKDIGLNVELDIRAETLGAKIRQHRMLKVPIIAVIGKDEMEKKVVTIEHAGSKSVVAFDMLALAFDAIMNKDKNERI